ncbi:class F sortase [Streptomonospora sp. S1-112]|uniref:Class F sortase n=1 Tax=Streptomonospora mangrovi TaxID=2883123 RepID=A0A9X3NXN6_9ACTN|nr:class F sortase [Streptomonospora mangrovi]MDA0566241.1 class F sortase [Streptomonospora mangrovi]
MAGEAAAHALAAVCAAGALLTASLGPVAAPESAARAPERPAHDAGGAPPAPAGAAHAAGAPVHLEIGAIGLRARLLPLGLDPEGALAQPPLERTGVAGWYALGPAPGDPGAAVITGHRDTRTGPSVFWRLGDLRPGDEIRVRRADGRDAVFAVRRSERVDKGAFPAEAVYGPVERPEIRLVTCAGAFDHATGHYERNLIVYGALARG